MAEERISKPTGISIETIQSEKLKIFEEKLIKCQ